jgi:hypothetical protein
MAFESSETWVHDEDGIKGFLSLREEHGVPYLVHFCVSRESRKHSLARHIVGFFKRLLRSRGECKAIVNAREQDLRLNSLISAYFKAQPYARYDGHNFYLIGV